MQISKRIFEGFLLHNFLFLRGVVFVCALVFGLTFPLLVSASGGAEGGHGGLIAETFLWLAVLLILSRIGLLIEKIGQPSVLGEILVGVLVGNFAMIGLNWFEPAKINTYLAFLAEFGVVLLLFRIGLESNLKEMSKVGLQAFLVACIGVVFPFVFGTFVVGGWLFPDISFAGKLFIGAAMTATSVGITARVFKDLGKLQMKEAKVVLGAAVIDDVLGLLILAIVSSIATVGTISFLDFSVISLKAVGFLIVAILLGKWAAKFIGKFLSKIHTGEGMKLSFALSFALLIAYLASLMGLAPIVGAFAAGLVLDPVHFKSFKMPEHAKKIREALVKKESKSAVLGHSAVLGEAETEADEALKVFEERHVEDLVDSLGHIFVPLFFIYTGMQVKLDVLFDGKVIVAALVVTFFAFLGKILAGFGAYEKGMNKLIVGFGMIPRGEVGLIFANVGKSLGVVNDELFSIIVVMVMFSTLFTPPILTFILKRQGK